MNADRESKTFTTKGTKEEDRDIVEVGHWEIKEPYH
jgi:hypothetical protein